MKYKNTKKIVTRDHLCWARPLSEGRQCALTRHTPAFGGESGNTPEKSSSPNFLLIVILK